MPTTSRSVRNDRSTYLEHYQLHHTPTTDILRRINAAAPKREVLLNVKITPDIAKDMLTVNSINRQLRKPDVRRWMADMVAGKWVPCGDTICFSMEGKLIDGQHRLVAIIETGLAQVYDIVTGLPPEAFDVKDTGRPRGAGDALSDRNFKYVNTMASAIKSDILFTQSSELGHFLTNQRVPNYEVKEWVNNPRNTKLMEECVEYATNYLRGAGRFLTPSSWAFIYYTFSSLHRNDALFFVNAFAAGENISTKKFSPIYNVRKILLDVTLKSNTKGHRATMPFSTKMIYIITAWNQFRKGENPAELVINLKGKIPKPR